MPRNVLNLELSSGIFSAGAVVGVAVREAALELSAEGGVGAAGAPAGARSAMMRLCMCFSSYSVRCFCPSFLASCRYACAQSRRGRCTEPKAGEQGKPVVTASGAAIRGRGGAPGRASYLANSWRSDVAGVRNNTGTVLTGK